MKWYLIKREIEPDIIGVSEGKQSTRMKLNYDYESNDSVWNTSKKNFSANDFVRIDFSGILLNNQAKFTDYISSEVINPLYVLIVSRNLLSFLNGFSVPVKSVSLATIIHSRMNIEIDYYSVFIGLQYDLINYNKSIFQVKETFNEKHYQDVRFSNYREFMDFLLIKTWKTSLKAKSLIINTNHHLICLPKLGGFIISEKLKDEIERGGFTGMRFELAEYIVQE